MRIGTVQLSEAQKKMLERAARGPVPARELARIFEIVAQDADILAGQEEIHPDWGPLFEARASDVRRVTSQQRFARLQAFFASLSPMDRTVCSLDPRAARVSFLLGAGASKPQPSNIPTVRELLPHLLERARRLERDDVTRLADFCDEREINNIEDLLTAAQLATFASRNPAVLHVVNYLLYRREEEPSDEALFSSYELARRRRVASVDAADVSSVAFLQDTLQVLFGLLASTMLPARPNKAHEAIARYTRDYPESGIVTTNYDCCMDLALTDAGRPLGYRVEFSNQRPPTTSDADTKLIKLHGSLNWFYCETCQEIQLVDLRAMVRQYVEDEFPYPVIGICKQCGGQRRGLLVPPLAMKFDVPPPLTALLAQAEETFESADIIAVVGFSFAEADLYISRMISKSMQTKTGQVLVLIDPAAEVAERVRRKFKVSIPSFDTSRIIRLSGDCSDLLPPFLSGALKTAPPSQVNGVSSGEQPTPDRPSVASEATH